MTALRAHWPEALLLAGVLATLGAASAATGAHPVKLVAAGVWIVAFVMGVVP